MHYFWLLGVVQHLDLLRWDLEGLVAEGSDLEGLFRDVVLDSREQSFKGATVEVHGREDEHGGDGRVYS